MGDALKPVKDIAEAYTGLSRVVLDYCLLMERLVDEAKRPGFSEADWAPLCALIAVDDFVRVGNFKEVMRWADYVSFLTAWAKTSEWACSFKRITEAGNLVFLELEERCRMGDFSSVVNSMTLYDFNAAGKLRHLDVYLQMGMPELAMLTSYGDVIVTN